MLQASRSWLFGPILRRSHTASTAPPQLGFAQIRKSRFHMATISTLRPEKLMYSDFLVLAGHKRFTLHTQLSLHAPSLPAKKGHKESIKLAYAIDWPGGGVTRASEIPKKRAKFGTLRVPFPEHAQGFLYLHQPQPESGLPRSASSLRIRCTPLLVKASAAHVASSPQFAEPEPEKRPAPHTKSATFLPPSVTNTEIQEAFEAGYDLVHPNDLTWNIPIALTTIRPYLKYVRALLLEDELFSESELQEYEKTYEKPKKIGKSVADPE